MKLLLAIDVGNTHLVLGLFRDQQLMRSLRVSTDRQRTVDEYGILLKSLLSDHGYDPAQVEGICTSNVVPVLGPVLAQMAEVYFDCPVTAVGPHSALGFTLPPESVEEVGSDLLAALVAARARYEGPLIVADLGTATTLVILSGDDHFQGAVISPGLAISMDAIISRAPHLPGFALEAPSRPFGTRTVECLQAGLVLGHSAMIEGLIDRIERELGPHKVVATGGLAPLLQQTCRRLDAVEPDLVLHGICQVFHRGGA